MTAGDPSAVPAVDLSVTNTQLALVRTDLANLRTLLAWARTSVSMIGFGFTIFNFYRGFLETLVGSGRQDAARNLGMALVATGIWAMIVAVWNYWSINQSIVALEEIIQLPKQLKRRWLYSYVMAAILIFIGLVTFVFMLRQL
jgi:uncharacterized membrane protein YidH (DUF202 family)